jgi:septum formation protein
MLLLREKFNNTRIILASGSPRRQFLLGELGIEFEVIDNAGIEETYPDTLDKKQIPVYLAEKKSDALKHLLDSDVLLITADTIVWCKKKVLDKPSGREDAIRILKELSGCRHLVISGVCLRSKTKMVSFDSVTSVFFRDLNTDEIIYYVDEYKPFDKAGAYGIQEWIGYTGIKSINGSYFNVMGLPMDKLYENLVSF